MHPFPYLRSEAPRLHTSIPLAKVYPNKPQEHSDPKKGIRKFCGLALFETATTLEYLRVGTLTLEDSR